MITIGNSPVYKGHVFIGKTPDDMMEFFDFIRLVQEINNMRPVPDWADTKKHAFHECKSRVIESLLCYLEDMTTEGTEGSYGEKENV